MSVGLKEISSATGYSVSTVSRVLSNKISGNSESAAHIIQAARDMGYNKYRDSINPDNRVLDIACLLYTSPSPRDQRGSRMPSSA